MSSKHVRDTVWAYLNANWVASPVVDLLNGAEALPVIPAAFVSVRFPPATEQQASVGAPGDNRWREYGSIVLIAYAPSGTGTSTILTHTEALRALFRGLQNSNVTFRAASPADTTLPSRVDASEGNYFGFGVNVDYIYDIIG